LSKPERDPLLLGACGSFLAVCLLFVAGLVFGQEHGPAGTDVVLVPGSPVVLTVEVVREVPAMTTTPAPTPPRCATPVEGLVCRWPHPEGTRPQGGRQPRVQ
jgi:hypothetical protein